jgi:hypothetical protein
VTLISHRRRCALGDSASTGGHAPAEAADRENQLETALALRVGAGALAKWRLLGLQRHFLADEVAHMGYMGVGAGPLSVSR